MSRIRILAEKGTRPRTDSVSEWVVEHEVRPQNTHQDINIVRADLRYPITIRIGESDTPIPEKSVLGIKSSFSEIIGWRPEKVAIEFSDHVPDAADLSSPWYVELCIGSEIRIRRWLSDDLSDVRWVTCRSTEESGFPHWWQRQRGVIGFSPDGKSIAHWETDEVDIGR